MHKRELSPLPKLQCQKMERLTLFLQHHLALPLTLADLTNAANMPVTTLSRHCNRLFGMSPMRWIWRLRVAFAAKLILEQPAMPLAKVAKASGFVSAAHFTRRFQAETGISPSKFRKEAKQGPTPGDSLNFSELNGGN